ncbi:hypothetical protein [Klebsiella quasipneumoniae]|uniref:hypothetical protein n=1 Tax=Klebsiella quasipneumoniae TaxID=1463165 RepID=UPI0023E2483E|nr:hypothetical protein [Klebsiella quasipneumoniae]
MIQFIDLSLITKQFPSQPLLFFPPPFSLTRWPCTISGRQIDGNAHKSKTIVIITSHNRYGEIVFPSGFALKMGS